MSQISVNSDGSIEVNIQGIYTPGDIRIFMRALQDALFESAKNERNWRKEHPNE